MGGAIFIENGYHHINRTKFIGNTCTIPSYGSVVAALGDKVLVTQSEIVNNTGVGIMLTGTAYIINSSIVNNSIEGVSAFLSSLNPGEIQNSILWNNGPTGEENYTNINVKNSCMTDPLFVDINAGNLRLRDGSPCIDQGYNYVDFNPFTPGFQYIPETDLYGRDRLVDGDGDGRAVIDAGSFEY